MQFVINPKLQIWVADALKNYHLLKKIAAIIPIDFVYNLALLDEIYVSQSGKLETQNRYFDKEVDALKWLLDDETEILQKPGNAVNQ
jgi:hypothetical protein